eukprot:Phypoly_transcript_01534.p1 GENE.Phypoly_transcript_01534~~Phypoly_transcript_01534.p1  ORF type:complete len:470 (+),score=89.89 Phypoly_transcript_01534:124-1533(+)
MISALCWIPQGKAKELPEKYTPTPREIEELKKSGLEEAASADMEGDKEMGERTDITKLYGFDKYDDEDDTAGEPQDIDDDPMVQLESDDEEDMDDLIIRPTDSLLLSIEANDENDLSHVDVYVYEEHNSNLYVHHDVFLSSFPLCVSWLDFNPKNCSTPSNLAAVGCFTPGIEIWDLDVLDAVYPVAMLGGTEKQTKSKTKKQKFLPGSHTDAVMGLDWNSNKRNLLASSSADTSVKVWDLSTESCVQTYNQHTDKVESVQWNPQEAAIILCGSYDKTVSIMDVRSPSSVTSLKWAVPADVEAIRWNPRSPQHFFVSCENGTVMMLDAMKGGSSTPVWSLDAHKKSVSALSINSAANLFATGSVDKTVKIWSYTDNKPELLHQQNIQQHVFSLSFYNSTAPHLLALGGENSTIKVLNTLHFDKVAPLFNKEVLQTEEEMIDNGMEEDAPKQSTKANKGKKKKTNKINRK